MLSYEYTDLNSQFCSVNYTIFIRKRDNFEQKPTRVEVARGRGDKIVKVKVDKALPGNLSCI